MDVNEAIYKVLTCHCKNDEKEAFQIVEDAGYKPIYSRIDRWSVTNVKTRKVIRHEWWFDHSKVIVKDDCMIVYGSCSFCKANFQLFLDEPIDDSKRTPYTVKSEAINKFEQISTLKAQIESSRRRIEGLELKIEECKQQILSEKKDIIKKEKQLKALRKKYHLND